MMFRKCLVLLLLLSLHAFPARGALLHRGSAPPPHAPLPPVAGRVLVVDDVGRFQLGPERQLTATRGALSQILARHGLSHGAALWRGANARGPRFLVLDSPRAEFDPMKVAAELRATGLVRAAVPDMRVRLHVVPNDPDVGFQWYVDDGGFADVSLPAAWDVERGSGAARIGVMDTGVDMSHPDLASKIWTNPGETAGNGVDDDANGYVDDVHGWDFGDGDNDPNPHAVPDPEAFDVDVGFHGTFVAGVAAAATDNGEGIAGAGWNCPVVPLKVVDSAGDISLVAMTEAFGYATAMHLEVLNMSLGVTDAPGVAAYFQALVDAATDAGVLCVASAGNGGTAALNYPAACAGVLSVAATDAANDRASFSNYGPTVRIAAPGAGMWSALCQNYPIDEFSQLFYEVFFGWDAVTPYMGGDGTSFSSPLVAGACALVRSRHPGWPPLVVGAHMVATGDVVGYDHPIGPRLNVLRAVTEQPLAVGPGQVVRSGLELFPNPFTAEALVRFELAAAGSARLRILDCSGRLVRELARSEYAAGSHALHWDGTDSRGVRVRPGMYLVRLDTPAGPRFRKLVRTR